MLSISCHVFNIEINYMSVFNVILAELMDGYNSRYFRQLHHVQSEGCCGYLHKPSQSYIDLLLAGVKINCCLVIWRGFLSNLSLLSRMQKKTYPWLYSVAPQRKLLQPFLDRQWEFRREWEEVDYSHPRWFLTLLLLPFPSVSLPSICKAFEATQIRSQ